LLNSDVQNLLSDTKAVKPHLVHFIDGEYDEEMRTANYNFSLLYNNKSTNSDHSFCQQSNTRFRSHKTFKLLAKHNVYNTHNS